MRKRITPIFGILILFALLLSACSGTALAALQSKNHASATPASTSMAGAQQVVSAPIQPGLLAAYESTLENIYSQVSPSVVNIRVLEKQAAATTQSPFSGLPSGHPAIPQSPQYSEGLGSGFVWDQQGYIVTNNHVVDGADKVEVTFSDGSTVAAKVVGKDLASDLAVIKVDLAADQLHPVQLADSTQVKVGELAIAIGNPFGLQGTMTTGIISAVGRSLPVGEGFSLGPSYTIPDILQTDAPINPGNSGGVLVNDQGQVMGVTAAIQSTTGANAGIGFAIPSAIVQKVVPVLIKSGHFDHPYLGISGTTLTPELAKAMKLKPEQRGALVEQVSKGGPAEKAGLVGSDRQATIDGQTATVGGDVITAIDGAPVKNMDDLIAYLMDKTEVGQKVTLTVLRDGKEKTMEVTLAARPAQTEQASTNTQSGSLSKPAFLGIQGATLTPELAGAMSLPQDQTGVLVQQVESGSPAEQAGLQGSAKTVTVNGQQELVGGDVIVAIDDHPITTLEELRAFIQQSQAGQAVALTVLRGGETLQVTVTLAERP